MPVELGNCQPFAYQQMMFVHNGLIENFYDTLYRPIREQLCDVAYRSIKGQTDSEHIFCAARALLGNASRDRFG